MNEIAKPDLSLGVGFIDGQYCPRGDMKISVHDLGFMMSDMTYDAAHVWKGRFFRLDDHMDRWERSVAKRKYNLAYDRQQVKDVVFECVRRSGLRESLVYWIATRGRAENQRRDLRSCANTFMAWAGPFNWIVPKEKVDRGEGANLYIPKDVVRTPPESSDPTVKNFSRLDFSRALMEAYEHGSEYPVLLDGDGFVTEGRGWNIFALFGGRLVSPDRGCLEGVTRTTVLDLCKKTNVKGELGRITGEELCKADEIFLSTTAGGVMPATHIDGKPIGNGQAGSMTLRFKEMYWALHDDPKLNAPVDYQDKS